MSGTPPRRIAIVLLAAIADNGVIGRGNALPFRQSSDRELFVAQRNPAHEKFLAPVAATGGMLPFNDGRERKFATPCLKGF